MCKKFCVCLCLLSFFLVPVAAGGLGLRLDFAGGGTFTFPTAEYLKVEDGPAARTSAHHQEDLELFDLRLDFSENSLLDFGLGLSFGGTGESLPYGTSILRSYTTMGFCLRASYLLSQSASLGFRIRILNGTFPASNSTFQLVEYEMLPSFLLQGTKHMDVCLLAPLTLSKKADTLSLRFGLGLSVFLGEKGGVK